MANSNANVNVKVGFSVDKSGLNEMQSLFQRIANQAQTAGDGLNSGLKKAGQTAQTLDGILEKTFNTDLGTLNVTKFNQELKKNGLTLKDVKNDLSQVGSIGTQAYNRLSQAILGTNLQLKESNKLLDDMAESMGNTVRWGITSAIFNGITNSIQKAVDYSRKLNTSLNDIRIVTEKSAESMEKFADKANQGAMALGASTLDYTQASLIYYQQGLEDAEVQARAETTLKAANVTGQSGEEVSEQLTAVWNGYKVTAAETELYVDKLAAVAASTASDLEELSKGMSKVASAANSMGVDVDQLNAQLATIISVTKQAPENVGTALKTIYARLGDLKADGTDEFGVSLGEVSSQLASMGIQILDQEGNLRDMGEVIEEVAGKWNSWTEAQRQAAAVAMAGKRQYNNLIALFDNWDMYTASLETSANAMGTLQKQQDIYMESTAAKLQKLRTAWQGVYQDFIIDDEVNSGIEAVTSLIQVLDNFVESFGGGIKTIMGFGAIIANIFNKQISAAINNAINRQQVYQQNLEALQKKNEMIQLGEVKTGDSAYDSAIAENTKIQLEYAKEIYSVRQGLTTEQYNELTGLQQQIGALEEEKVLIQKTAEELESAHLTSEAIQEILKGTPGIIDEINTSIGEIETQSEEELDIRKEEVKFLKDQIKDLKTIQEIKDELISADDGLVNKELGLNRELEKQIEKLFQEKDENETIFSLRGKINNILAQYVKNQQEVVEAVKEEGAAVDKIDKIRLSIAKKNEQQNNVKQQANDMLELAKSNKKVAQTVSDVTASIGSMAMAWSSVNSLIETWKDDSVDLGDKLLQTLTVIGMNVPMIITNFEKLKSSFDIITLSQERFTTAMAANKAMREAQTLAEKASIAVSNAESAQQAAEVAMLEITAKGRAKRITNFAEEVAARELNLASMTAEEAVEQALSLAKEKSLYLSKEEQAAYIQVILARQAEAVAEVAETAAKEGETIATEQATAAQWALNAAMDANPIGLIIIALTALVAVIAGTVKAYDALTINAEEAQEIAKESAKAYNDSANQLKGLRDELDTTKERIEELYNIAQERDLTIVEKEELARLEAQNIALETQIALKERLLKTQQYQAARDIKQSVEKGNFDHEFISAGPESSTSEESSIPKQNSRFSYINDKYGIDIKMSDEAPDISEITAIDKESFDKWLEATEEVKAKFGDEIKAASDAGNEELANDLLKASEDFTNEVELYRKDWEQSNLEALTILEEDYQDAIEGLQAVYAQVTTNGVADDDNTVWKDTLRNLQDATHDYYKASGTLEKTVTDVFKGSLENQEILTKIINNADNILKDDTRTIDESVLKGILSEEEFNNLQTMAQTLGLSLYDLIYDARYFNISIEETAETAEQKLLDLNSALENSRSLYKEIQNGNIDASNIKESDYWKELSKNFDGLKEKCPELRDEINLLNQTELAGTQEYLEALEKVEDKLTELDIANAMEDANKAIDDFYKNFKDDKGNIEIGADPTKFQEAIDKIINSEYSIDVKIHTEAEQEFDSISTGFEKVQEMASKIGEDFIVAATDLRELNNTFPGILEGMEDLGDGTVKLNEKMVETAMAGAEAEARADAEATIEKLHNQAQLLRAKQQIYTKMANAALVLAKGESATAEESADAQAEMSKGLADLKALNSKESAQSEMNNAVQVANDSKTNAEIVEQNWDGAFKKGLGESSYINAKAAIQNMTAVSENKPELLTEGASVQYEGSSGFDSEASITAMTEEALQGGKGDENWAAIAEKYAAIADSAGEAANDIEGMIAQIGATGTSLDKKFKNISEGKGPEEKDKSEKEKERSEKEGKKLEDEFDRYWEIKKAIDAVDTALNKLSKDQEHLYGDELADSLMKTNELLDQQAANYARLAEEQRKEAAELQGVLGGMGVTFDASGAITNYAAATTAALAQYNEAIAKYNAGLIDEASFKIYETQYELFKKQLERYDQLFYTEMKETQEKLEEIERQKKANNLKAWEVKLQVKLEMKELKREWNNFLSEINSDFKRVYKDLRAEVETMKKNAKTYGGKSGTIMTEINALDHVEKEIDKMRSGGISSEYESISQAQEKLKELNQKLIDDAKAFHDLIVQAWEAYYEGIDQVKDQLDDIIDRYDKINDRLKYQKQLVELIYGPEAYHLMDTWYKAAEHNSLSQLDSLVKQRDEWKKLFEEAREKAGASMTDTSKWTKEMMKYYENWQEAQGKLYDQTVEYINLLKDDYTNAVKSAIKELEMYLTSGKGLTSLQEDWERRKAASDKYLDEVEKSYGILSFENKVDKSIDATEDIKAQQKLAKLREQELKDLREKKKLTQYDLDAANARLKIAEAEIALEEAQNNKNSMKVVRNEEGNWSYQYVAEEEDVATKRQELLDSYNDLYELAKNAYEENLSSMMALTEEYLQRKEEIETSMLLDDTQRAQALAELEEWYYNESQALAEENELYKQDMTEAGFEIQLTAYEQDHEIFSELTKEKRDIFEEAIKEGMVGDLEKLHIAFKDTTGYMDKDLRTLCEDIKKQMSATMSETLPIWTSGAQGLIDLWNKDDGKSVKAAITKANDAITAAAKKYEDQLKQLEKVIGETFGDLEEQINANIEATDELDGAMERACQNGEKYIDDLRKAAEDLEEQWNRVKDAIEDAIRKLEEYLQMKGQAGTGTNDGFSPSGGSTADSTQTPSGKDTEKDDASSNEDTDSDSGGYKQRVIYAQHSRRALTEVGKMTYGQAMMYALKHSKTGDTGVKIGKGVMKDYWIAYGLKSGGYTGSWSGADTEENGKLAMLHQKELVLNADDTQNLLNAVGIVRALGDFIAATTAGLGNISAPSIRNAVSNSSNTYGDVIIQAEFPNASDVEEIREAILSLPNLAAQYFANQNTR